MEYKWYAIKVDYRYQKFVSNLVSGDCSYFKELYIPYHGVYNLKYGIKDSVERELCDIYVLMHLCDESKNILMNQIPDFCNSEITNFRVISSEKITSIRMKFDKYKWYILRVASNYEERVCQHISENSARLGIKDFFKEIFLPYEEPSEMELRLKKTVVRKKCFPGYIFLYLDLCDEVLNFVNNMPKSLKVYGFLKNGNIPKVILDEEIRSMCSALFNAQEAKKLSHGYERGEKVKINDGLFQNFIGKVDIINDEKKVISVEVSILGKPTLIELDLAQVEKVED